MAHNHSPRWAVTVSYEAPNPDRATEVRDLIAYQSGISLPGLLTVSDVIGVPAEDEPTTHVDNVDTY